MRSQQNVEFSETGLEARLPTTEGKVASVSQHRKEDRHICNDPLIKVI